MEYPVDILMSYPNFYKLIFSLAINSNYINYKIIFYNFQ